MGEPCWERQTQTRVKGRARRRRRAGGRHRGRPSAAVRGRDRALSPFREDARPHPQRQEAGPRGTGRSNGSGTCAPARRGRKLPTSGPSGPDGGHASHNVPPGAAGSQACDHSGRRSEKGQQPVCAVAVPNRPRGPPVIRPRACKRRAESPPASCRGPWCCRGTHRSR